MPIPRTSSPSISPSLGSAKNHIGIELVNGLISTWDTNVASAPDGAAQLKLISQQNTGSGLYADTASRAKKNEDWLEKGMFKGNLHQKRVPPRSLAEHGVRMGQCKCAAKLG